MGVGGHRHTSATLSLGKRQVAGWTPVPVWTGGEEDHSPPEFDPRTLQPVARHFTHYKIPTHPHFKIAH
jgi:hypothetical protein